MKLNTKLTKDRRESAKLGSSAFLPVHQNVSGSNRQGWPGGKIWDIRGPCRFRKQFFLSEAKPSGGQ